MLMLTMHSAHGTRVSGFEGRVSGLGARRLGLGLRARGSGLGGSLGLASGLTVDTCGARGLVT
jgi:hypothetical protein